MMFHSHKPLFPEKPVKNELSQEKKNLSIVQYEILQTRMHRHSIGSEMKLFEASYSSIYEPRHKKTCFRGF